MTDALGWDDVMWFGATFEAALLASTGLLHLTRPEHLRSAARAHRDHRVVPARLGVLERPVVVGGAELVLACAAVLTIVGGGRVIAVAVQVAIGVFAAGSLALISRLRRVPRAVPCGCHPFETAVGRMSALPAVALLVAAVVAAAGVASDAVAMPASTTVVTGTAMLAALTAGTTLVYAGAANVPRLIGGGR